MMVVIIRQKRKIVGEADGKDWKVFKVVPDSDKLEFVKAYKSLDGAYERASEITSVIQVVGA